MQSIREHWDTCALGTTQQTGQIPYWFVGYVKMSLQNETFNLVVASVRIYCIGALQTWKSQACGSTNLALSAFKAVFSSSASPSNVFDWPSRSFLFKGPATQAKFGTKRWNKLHRAKSNGSSITLLGHSSPCMVSIVHANTLKKPGEITWQRSSMRLVNNSHFFQFNRTPASCNKVSTCRPWQMCSSGFRENMTMSFK